MKIDLVLNKYFILAILMGWLLVRCSYGGYSQYTVQSGDTLYGISAMFDVNMRELQRLNGIDEPRKLQVGTVLDIPNVVRSNKKESGQFYSRDYGRLRTVQLGNVKKYVGHLTYPLARKGRLSSRFGYRWHRLHKGIDLAAPYGTPILAAHAGKVLISGVPFSGYGNMVAVATDDGLLTLYAHTSRNLVRVGDYVHKGQRIALVGSSGRSTGPHLHFEIRLAAESGFNTVVDPIAFY